jgi:short subunit dehydrogenase-like uncharacterized protein
MVAAVSPRLSGLVQGRVLPAPGEGPSAAEREAGFFEGRLVGKGRSSSGASVRLEARIKGRRDPGYGATARMLGEAAVCLAKDVASLPARAGVLTPASAMGEALLARLERADVRLTLA